MAGLIDADGSIGHPNKGFKLTISFHEKDHHLALKLQSLFSGSIYKEPFRKLYTYYLGGHNLKKILPFIYDKLQHTVKRERCFILSSKLGFPMENALQPWEFDIKNNHWLSGFIDGDGCFQIYLPKTQGGVTIYLAIDLNINSYYILQRTRAGISELLMKLYHYELYKNLSEQF